MAAPVLIQPDWSRPFVIHTDASAVGCGGVLQQDLGHGLQPIAYYSRKLSSAERNYSAWERECLGLVTCITHFRTYVQGADLTVCTDQSSLRTLLKQEKLTQRQVRWIETIQSYQFNIQPVAGSTNVVADALSRNSAAAGPDNAQEFLPMVPDDVAAARAGPWLTKQLQFDKTGDAHELTRPVWGIEPQQAHQHGFKKESNVAVAFTSDSCKHTGQATAAVQVRVSQSEQFLHELQQAYKADSMFADTSEAKQTRRRLSIKQQGNLFKRKGKLVLPPDSAVLKKALQQVHEQDMAHLGVHSTLRAASKAVWAPRLRQAVRVFVKECATCQRCKGRAAQAPPQVQPLPVPARPWEWITTDMVTGFQRDRKGHNAVAVFVDRFSKQAHFAPTSDTVTAQGYAQLYLEHVYRHHGLARTITSDRDPRFTAEWWDSFHRALGTRLKLSTAYHPQTDGQSKRAIRTLQALLRAHAHDAPDQWARFLPQVEFAYNSALNAATGSTPFEVVYGTAPLTPLQLVTQVTETVQGLGADEAADVKSRYNAVHERLCKAADRMAAIGGRAPPATLAPGTSVLLSTSLLNVQGQARKTLPKYCGPFQVLRDFGGAVELQLPPALHRLHNRFNKRYIKQWIGSDTAEDPLLSQQDVHIEPAAQRRVAKVLDVRGNGEHEQVRVRWDGLDLAHDEWVQARDLDQQGVALYNQYMADKRAKDHSRVKASGHNLRSKAR